MLKNKLILKRFLLYFLLIISVYIISVALSKTTFIETIRVKNAAKEVENPDYIEEINIVEHKKRYGKELFVVSLEYDSTKTDLPNGYKKYVLIEQENRLLSYSKYITYSFEISFFENNPDLYWLEYQFGKNGIVRHSNFLIGYNIKNADKIIITFRNWQNLNDSKTYELDVKNKTYIYEYIDLDERFHYNSPEMEFEFIYE